MNLFQARDLLARTRLLTVLTTVFLTIQLSGNLYEEIVSNPRNIVSPQPGLLVSELAIGSPLYFYLPWVPIGLILAIVLALKVRRLAPSHISRRLALSLLLLAGAVIAKVHLIRSVNPNFRDASIPAETLRSLAIEWAFVNGAAILFVAGALWLIISWRPKLLDAATIAES